MVKKPLIRRLRQTHMLQDHANGTLCDTHNLNNINFSAPFTRKPSNELKYITWDMDWYCPNLTKCRPEGRFNRCNSSESNPFAPSVDLPHWLTINPLIQTAWNIFKGKIPYWNLIRPLPEIVSNFKTNCNEYNQFAVSKIKRCSIFK